MNLRRLEKSDWEQLIKIHDNHFNYPFPDITNPLYAIQRVVTEKDNIIVAGLVKLTSEGIFITDKSRSEYQRMKAIKILLNQMYKDVVNFGLEDCHTFAENDDNYINILRKLGFIDCTGFPMVRLK